MELDLEDSTSARRNRLTIPEEALINFEDQQSLQQAKVDIFRSTLKWIEMVDNCQISCPFSEELFSTFSQFFREQNFDQLHPITVVTSLDLRQFQHLHDQGLLDQFPDFVRAPRDQPYNKLSPVYNDFYNSSCISE